MTRAAVAVLCVLALAGCSSVGVTGKAERSWLKPWTWRGDKATEAARLATRVTGAEADVLRAAQRSHETTVNALREAPVDVPSVALASRTAGQTHDLMTHALGPLPLADTQASEALVADALSGDPERVERAEAALAKSDRHNMALTAELSRWRDHAALQQNELQAAYLRERATADRWHTVMWIAGGLVVLWLLSQVLSIAARVNPAFAGAAALANGIITPVGAYAYKRAQDGLAKVGQAMQEAREKVPEIAERMEALLDNKLDADHKAVARRAAMPAGGTTS